MILMVGRRRTTNTFDALPIARERQTFVGHLPRRRLSGQVHSFPAKLRRRIECDDHKPKQEVGLATSRGGVGTAFVIT